MKIGLACVSDENENVNNGNSSNQQDSGDTTDPHDEAAEYEVGHSM